MRGKLLVVCLLLLTVLATGLPLKGANAQTGTGTAKTVTLTGSIERYDRYQLQGYSFTASKGPLTVTAHKEVSENQMRVVVQNRGTQETVLDATLDNQGTKTVTLAADGSFSLFVIPVWNGGQEMMNNTHNSIDLTANDLVVPDSGGTGVAVYQFQAYEVKNAPFSLNLQTFYGSAANVLVKLDQTQLVSQAPLANGTVPLTIDPSKLADGLHTLHVEVTRPNSENVTMLDRVFVVDRTPKFADVPMNYWGHRPVELLADLGVVKGRTATSFAPEQAVKREEFALMLASILNLKPTSTANPFVDTGNSFAKDAIHALYDAGLASGQLINGKRYYLPTQTIKRAEAAAIIGRSSDVDKMEIGSDTGGFHDFASIPSYARSSVVVLAYSKWINGYPDGNFYPARTLTRGQAAQVLSKYLGL